MQKRLALSRATEGFSERHAYCWLGYLAALLEWRMISVDDYSRLADLMPVDDPSPELDIFLG